MKTFGTTKIIGVDHGYGNMKTANHCFPTGIDAYDSEPLFTRDMLVYDGRYYLIGEGHKEFVGEKSQDDDFYLLTLAAVAMELHDEGLTEADVFLAAGLPLTWTANQKEAFAAYLSRNEEVRFVWKKVAYHIRIVGVRIYPQGFAAIAEKAAAEKLDIRENLALNCAEKGFSVAVWNRSPDKTEKEGNGFPIIPVLAAITAAFAGFLWFLIGKRKKDEE